MPLSQKLDEPLVTIEVRALSGSTYKKYTDIKPLYTYFSCCIFWQVDC